METNVRTIYGAHLQTAQLLGKPFDIMANSTLNQKFNIHNNVAVGSNELPAMKYVGIGNGGHSMVVGANGIPRPEPIQHTPRHSGMFNQLPFVLRRIDNDLTPIQRANYRLRRIETHDGDQYVAYYLKLLDMINTEPQLELRTVLNGTTTSQEFSPELSDLSPVPPVINTGGVLTTTGDYIAATAKIPFIMSASDITEFIDACNVIYGDDSYAIISEISLCSGIDRTLEGNFNGATASYTDAIAVQILNHISAFYAAKFTATGINVMFDVGSVEPLLALS